MSQDNHTKQYILNSIYQAVNIQKDHIVLNKVDVKAFQKLTSPNKPQSAALQHHKLPSPTDRPTATASPHHTPVMLEQKQPPQTVVFTQV